MKHKGGHRAGIFAAQPYTGPGLVLVFGCTAVAVMVADTISEVDAAFARVLAALRRERL